MQNKWHKIPSPKERRTSKEINTKIRERKEKKGKGK